MNKKNHETEIVKICRVVGVFGGGVLDGSICFVPGLMISMIGCGAVGAIILGSASGAACG